MPKLKELGAAEQLGLILDRLTCLACTTLILRKPNLFRRIVGALLAVYNLPVGPSGDNSSGIKMDRAALWFEVIQRVVVIGGMAVRLGGWELARELVLQKGKGFDFEHYPNWYRHGLTMAASAGLLTLEQGGRRTGSSMISFAQTQSERLSCTHPDLSSEDEGILDSLCQFDFLASLVAIDDVGTPDGSAFYPSFARYRSHRSLPVLYSLLGDPRIRRVVFSGTDAELAAALNEIDRLAHGEGFMSWSGYGSKLYEFIESNLSAEN